MAKHRNGIGARREVREKNPQCFYCGGKTTTADHLIPASHGGPTTKENMVGACEFCNTDKGDMTLEEYRVFRTVRQVMALGKALPVVNVVSMLPDYKFYGEGGEESWSKNDSTMR